MIVYDYLPSFSPGYVNLMRVNLKSGCDIIFPSSTIRAYFVSGIMSAKELLRYCLDLLPMPLASDMGPSG
jgi:hypothetical protein